MKDQMNQRLRDGLDPLTGEKMQTVGGISVQGGTCRDETGREVALNDKGTWVYK